MHIIKIYKYLLIIWR